MNRFGDEFSCDWGKRNTQHRMSGRYHQVVISMGSPDDRKPVWGARTEALPDRANRRAAKVGERPLTRLSQALDSQRVNARVETRELQGACQSEAAWKWSCDDARFLHKDG
jgi:hypothetical protein